jgi:hypothetical protein
MSPEPRRRWCFSIEKVLAVRLLVDVDVDVEVEVEFLFCFHAMKIIDGAGWVRERLR